VGDTSWVILSSTLSSWTYYQSKKGQFSHSLDGDHLSAHVLLQRSWLIIRPRVAGFCKVVAAQMIADLVGTPLAAVMMRKTPWLPVCVSTLVLIIAGIVLMKLPETHPSLHLESKEDKHAIPEVEHKRSVSGPWRGNDWNVAKSIRILTQSSVVMVMFMVYLVTSIGPSSILLLLQYMTKRYGWDYSTVRTSIPSSPAHYMLHKKVC
jgi:hypothetical protein